MIAKLQRAAVAVVLVVGLSLEVVGQSASTGRALRSAPPRAAAENQAVVREQLAAGNAIDAFPLLERILRDTDDLSGPLQTEAERAIAALPLELHERLEQQMAPRAQDVLTAALTGGDEPQLALALRQYGWTRAGAAGWLAAGLRARDTARWQTAEAAGRRVLAHRAATPTQRASALLLTVESLLQSGKIASATRIWDDSKASLGNVPVRQAGRARPLEDLITEQFRPAGELVSESTSTSEETLPVLVARWQRDLRPSAPVSEGLALLAKPFRAHGAISFPVQQPVVAGNAVLLRTIDQVIACDLTTGEKLWRAALPEFSRLQDHPALLENSMYRTAILDSFWRREQVDSVFASLTTDGERVFVVEESSDQARQMLPQRPSPPERDDEPPPPISNHLAAYDVSTGDLAWRIGGESVSPSYPLGGVYFLGPPTAVDEALFGVGQRSGELGVYAIDRRRGELLWWVTLGQVERPLSGDLLRRGTACPVVWEQGLLICPTTAGVVAAVDATTRQLRWLTRYPDRQREIVLPQPGAIRPRSRPESWWDAWRTASVWPVGDRILSTSPESNEWLLINVADGSVVQRGLRNGAIAVVGIVGQTLVLAESSAIRGVDLTSGEVRWRAVTGDLAGQGVIHGDVLVQPLAEGTLATIQIEDGRVDWLRGGDPLPMGRLTRTSRGWLLAGPGGLCALASRSEAAGVIESLPTSAGGPAREVRLARLELQRGRPHATWERLIGSMNDTRREALLTTGLAWLERDASIWKTVQSRLLELALSADERFTVRLSLLDAAVRAGEPEAALTFALDALEERPEGTCRIDSSPMRVVRRDRLLQGRIDQLLRAAEPSARSVLDQRLEERLGEVLAKKDPFGVQGWLDRLGPLPWARERTLEHQEAAFLGRSLLETELRLLDLSGGSRSRLHVDGRVRLAELLRDAGFPRDGHAILADLSNRQPGARSANGANVAGLWRGLQDRPEWTGSFQPATDVWPVRKPWSEAHQRRNENVYQFGAEVRAEPGSLIDRLDVSIDRQGRWVQFAGDGQSGPWRADLPSSSSPFRYVYFRHATWGWGRLAIVRVGSELFAVTPFNARGEPQAQVLWTIDTAATIQPMSDQVDVVPLRDRTGVRSEELTMFDPFGREIAAVGPVRPRYLCYREQSVLRAIETSTGAVLWERFDLPDGTITFGDDDAVAVWQPTSGRLELLSAIDGRTLEVRNWAVSPDDLLQIEDLRAWVVERGPQTVVRLVDVATNKTLWRQVWFGDATPFLLDRQTIGLLDPRGVLAVFSAETGGLLGEPLTVDCPAAIDRIAVAADADRWYVTWTPRLENLWLLLKGQPRSSFRMPFVDGTLLAIDRSRVQIDWRRTLHQEPFPIDQFRNAPVLWQIWKLPASGSGGNQLGDGLVRLIDKRTGEIAYEARSANMQPYLNLQADPESQLLDLQLSNETVRLHYRGEPPPPEEAEKEP